MADAGVSAFAMELMPRITRAEVMDVLSSQANLAGYRAVIEAGWPPRHFACGAAFVPLDAQSCSNCAATIEEEA
jgi:NAD/NADP transhydrogenase alpha subunit